ncbi:hypothetical protein R8Z50_12200 [Longispora sp. K20-0274]|uniref:hypothetical protein n=1 Tax=Longispora sp. K20-0274 TaxID=3088255 RepID=UPI00399B004E
MSEGRTRKVAGTLPVPGADGAGFGFCVRNAVSGQAVFKCSVYLTKNVPWGGLVRVTSAVGTDEQAARALVLKLVPTAVEQLAKG